MAITLKQQTSGSVSTPAATEDSVFFDSSDGLLKYKDSSGTVTSIPTSSDLTAAVVAGVNGLSWKASVRVATTAAKTLATDFENGDTIDGVVLATGDRVLIKDQASGAENGIYTVNASGAPTRATDMDGNAEALQATCYVREGTANADTAWTCTTNTITLGSTALAFSQLGSAVTDATISTSDITTNNASSTKHGFQPKSPADATKFLNGAATPAYAQVKDSDLSTSDITTNDVSITKHGFAPKAPNDATKYLDGSGSWSVPSGGGGGTSEFFSDVTKSADYTVVAPTDKGRVFVCTNTLTLTLPAATDTFWFGVYNNTSAKYVVVGSILMLLPGEFARIASDGSGWFVLDSKLTIPINTPARRAALGNVADDYFYSFDTAGTRISGATAWGWRNQGTSTVTAQTEGSLVLVPQVNSQQHGVEQSTSGTFKYRCQLIPRYDAALGGTEEWMMYVAETGGKAIIGGIGYIGGVVGIHSSRWNSFTSFSADLRNPSVNVDPPVGQIWMECEYDGTNIVFRYSPTGEDSSFSLLISEPKASFLVNAPIFVGVSAYATALATALVVKNWQRVA